MGTHPTREKITLPLSEAVKRISDKDMTEMCLTVNMTFGSAMANKLLPTRVAVPLRLCEMIRPSGSGRARVDAQRREDSLLLRRLRPPRHQQDVTPSRHFLTSPHRFQLPTTLLHGK